MLCEFFLMLTAAVVEQSTTHDTTHHIITTENWKREKMTSFLGWWSILYWTWTLLSKRPDIVTRLQNIRDLRDDTTDTTPSWCMVQWSCVDDIHTSHATENFSATREKASRGCQRLQHSNTSTTPYTVLRIYVGPKLWQCLVLSKKVNDIGICYNWRQILCIHSYAP